MIGSDKLGDARDDIYAALLDAHDGLDDADSQKLNARLVLMLANEVADPERLTTIFAEARRMAGT